MSVKTTRRNRMKHTTRGKYKTKHARIKGKGKKTRSSVNMLGGDRWTVRHRTRRVAFQIRSQQKHVHDVFVALEKLAGAKVKVEYLLDSIERGPNRPGTISQWKALFNANKFRKSNTSALKDRLLDPFEYGSIAQLSTEAMDNVRQTGKELENKIGTRNSGRNIIKALDYIFRTNVDHSFINIQDDGRSSHGYALDKNIWQPEADLLFAEETADMYDFDNIEESKIINQPPIKVKWNFRNNSIVRSGLTFIWNFLFDTASISNTTIAEEKLTGMYKGWPGLGFRKILRIINTLTGVYEKRFTALIPYLPASMFKDTPEDDPDYDDVGESTESRVLAAREEVARELMFEDDTDGESTSSNWQEVARELRFMGDDEEEDGEDETDGEEASPAPNSGYMRYVTGIASDLERQTVIDIYPQINDIVRRHALTMDAEYRETYGDPYADIVHDETVDEFREIRDEMRGRGEVNGIQILRELLTVMETDVLHPVISRPDLYTETVSNFLADTENYIL